MNAVLIVLTVLAGWLAIGLPVGIVLGKSAHQADIRDRDTGLL